MEPYSIEELARLEEKARCFTNKEFCNIDPEIHILYRNKPKKYFEEIFEGDGIMETYKKDDGGDPRCPINNKLPGLFFLGKKYNHSSPFGDTRIEIPVGDLFSIDHNLYFADFFCMSPNHHYVTTVVTVPGSQADRFCKRSLLQLDKYNNPYMKLSWDGRRVYMAQGKYIWVEVFYTEDINVRTGCEKNQYKLTRSDIIGEGQSRPNGILKRSRCDICNL